MWRCRKMLQFLGTAEELEMIDEESSLQKIVRQRQLRFDPTINLPIIAKLTVLDKMIRKEPEAGKE